MNYCTKCGDKLNSLDKFCANCGNKIDANYTILAREVSRREKFEKIGKSLGSSVRKTISGFKKVFKFKTKSVGKLKHISNEKTESSNNNLLIRVGNGIVSFIVGLSALAVIKLVFMLPLNLMLTPENADTMQTIGFLLIIVAIYLAVKFTKNLNRSGTRKSRNIKRTITIVLGFVCMIAINGFFVMSRLIQSGAIQ